MVGINVPIAYYPFGGWKKSGFGDLNQHGPVLERAPGFFLPAQRPPLSAAEADE